MRWEQRVSYAVRTDVGMRRRNNEDSHVVRLASDGDEFQKHGHLFVVADGMGGHAVGELASKLAVETVSHMAFKSELGRGESLQESITVANRTINERGSHNRDFERMGTTCTALVLGPRGVILGHVGDSRAYRVRRDRIDQLTFDHSLEWEFKRRYPGRKTDSVLARHKNVITRSLGPEPEIKVDLEGPIPIMPRDRFVVCSDGLTGLVADDEIGAIVRLMPPKEACVLLVDLANLRGGNDNCTVVVAEVGDLPHGVPPPEEIEEEEPQSTPLRWELVAGFWASFAGLALGGTLLLTGNRTPGLTFLLLAFVAIAGLTALAVKAKRGQQKVEEDESDDASRTMHNRPHATAVAIAPDELLRDLAAAESELSAAAREDDWPVKWPEHAAAMEAAQAAAEEKRAAVSIREIAKAIRLLMVGLKCARAGEPS